MLGNEVLKSLMVYSRTNIALFGCGYETVVTSHKGSVKAPCSACKTLFVTLVLKSEHNYTYIALRNIPGKTDVEAPKHAT